MPKNKPLDSMTRLDAEKESKKRAEELAEEIDLLGQDDEFKAADLVIEKGEEERYKQDEEEFYTKEKLSKRSGNLYYDSIKNEAKRRIASYDIPPGFYIDCTLTSKGLAFGWRHYSKNVWYMKGMKISENPTYDLAEVDKLINEALDEIGRMDKGQDEKKHKMASGLELPN